MAHTTVSNPLAKKLRTWPVAHGVYGLTTGIVNLFFVGEPGALDNGWVLIDAGMQLSAKRILRAAQERYGDARPAAILLTHGHFDHIGALSTLSEFWDVPIFCHENEAPFLSGKLVYPPADASLPGFVAFMSRLFPRCPEDYSRRLQLLPTDGSVPFLPDWQYIETPGHAPGHVSFFRPADRILVAGDAIVSVAQESMISIFKQEPRVHRPPAYFTPDWASARRSVEKLAALQPLVAATGHGPVLNGELLERGLKELLDHWEDRAVPAGGRYSTQSPHMDQERISKVPAAKFDYRLLVLAGLGLWAMLRRRKFSSTDEC
jgi:glyoxylase-like metal-dependent hydrolase (beta-lactamase superfamily II)